MLLKRKLQKACVNDVLINERLKTQKNKNGK